MEYKPDMSETDPKALFQQRVPKTFLSLQEKIQEKVFQLKKDGKAPIMEEADFRTAFLELFDDEEELNEAVYFLNLQGACIHIHSHRVLNTSIHIGVGIEEFHCIQRCPHFRVFE